MLNAVGFDVREAADRSKPSRFVDWKPHAIAMDLRMPVDGAGAILQIRHPEGREVKIIALTASAFEENRQFMIRIGAVMIFRANRLC